LVAELGRIAARIGALEANKSLGVCEFDVEIPDGGEVVLNHRLGGPVRWYVTSWRRKTAAGLIGLTEVDESGSDSNTLVLYSIVPGRAVIRVELAQAGLLRDQTTRTAVEPGGGSSLAEIVFGAESFTTTATYTRLGARVLDMSLYPGASSVKFYATLENTLDSADWYSQVRLFDITHNVAIGGTTLDNSAASDRSVAENLASTDITVGSSSGDIRSDSVTLYSVQFRANGTITDPSIQRAVIGNARIVIT
jgi:hypothetical protein